MSEELTVDLGFRHPADAEVDTHRGRGANPLTAHERQTVDLVDLGLASRQIAILLFLTPRTVEYHLSHVYQRLGASSRVELARLLVARP